MKKKKRETGFEKFARRLLIFSFALFIVGVVGLNSYETDLNIATENVENDIATLESDIDGLNMKKQELASFSRISSIAEKNGYTYKQNTATAVVGVQSE